jgi:hypothetical protein
MDAMLYREIISDYLIPFIIKTKNFDFILHQDNDPKHTSKLCENFLKMNKINWAN